MIFEIISETDPLNQSNHLSITTDDLDFSDEISFLDTILQDHPVFGLSRQSTVKNLLNCI